ncbi:NAD(P)/FAD-dependent oxidoreductase [Kribbella antibiotica]|uniref:Pyridine nucleotide-disulfide oxidoreductase domain-containing protein 2 n=1 Tax=Kribbella antibiotica TaxID=190195 RepID=A0A4R4YLZ0_9ACTN|nr:NAD(P)/FAD-dependent oxidoreductase [Kribbella antibiotica]TDD46048.1 NAD(P)/FAD-dependent oxidoreductase [Kribbella antibiotica]
MTDAVVVGAGPNGLVAANLLIDAGWDVTLLEANDAVGGAVRSSTDVDPAFVHDTFSSFYPLAAVSPTIRKLNLSDYGLEWSNAPSPVGNPLSTGGWALVHPEPADTAAALDALQPGDGQAWLDLYGDWERVGPAVLDALLSPFPPVRAGIGVLRELLGARGLKRLQLLLGPTQWVGNRRFTGEAAKMLMATNSQHADIAPTAPGSGLMGWLLVMIAQQHGYPVPRGGAGKLSQALADRFAARGGTVVCQARVDRIVIRDGRAVAVRTVDGTEYAAGRAVLADVSAPALYRELIPREDLPGHVQQRLRAFRWDPGTIKVDWALNSPIPWQVQPELAPGTVHLADSVADLRRWSKQLTAGQIPDRPFLLMGHMTTADPSRSPAGTESAWAYTHVPQQTRGDAGGQLTGRWDDAEAEVMADRMQARVEQFAPGFTEQITARRILSPVELERRNANLVGGAVNGGTSGLRQELFLRPMPGLGRAETAIKSLYLASASAHPGGGVHGACGSNAARAALFHSSSTEEGGRVR